MTACLNDIPSAAGIDYTDAAAVCACGQLLARLLESHGALDVPQSNTPAVRALLSETRQWLSSLRPLIGSFPLASVPGLLDAYIFLDGVGNGRRDVRFYDEVRMDAVTRWLSGDRTLTEAQAVTLLQPMLTTPEGKRYSQYCASRIAGWIRDLRQHGSFPGVDAAETYRRLDYILRHDLVAFVPGGKREQTAAKLRWAIPSLPSDITLLTTPSLLACLPLAQTLVYLIQDSGQHDAASVCGEIADGIPSLGEDYLEVINMELASRGDLHPFHREAIRTGMETRRRLLAPSLKKMA